MFVCCSFFLSRSIACSVARCALLHKFFFIKQNQKKRNKTHFPIKSTQQTRTNGRWKEKRNWKKNHHFEVELFEKFVAFLRLSFLLQPNHLYLLECILLSWHSAFNSPYFPIALFYSQAICAAVVIFVGTMWNKTKMKLSQILIWMIEKERKKSIQTNLKVRFSRLLCMLVHPLVCSIHRITATSSASVILEQWWWWWRHFVLCITVPKYHQNDGRRCENVVFQLFGFLFIAFHVLTLCERNETKRNRFVAAAATVVVYFQDFAGIFISR